MLPLPLLYLKPYIISENFAFQVSGWLYQSLPFVPIIPMTSLFTVAWPLFSIITLDFRSIPILTIRIRSGAIEKPILSVSNDVKPRCRFWQLFPLQ